jgi:hypothetical protein
VHGHHEEEHSCEYDGDSADPREHATAEHLLEVERLSGYLGGPGGCGLGCRRGNRRPGRRLLGDPLLRRRVRC